MGDTGDPDAVLGYGELAVVEELDYAQQPGVPGHGYVEHEQPVEEEVYGEEAEDDGGGELEPWYAQGGEGEEIEKVQQDPLGEVVKRTAVVLEHLHPVVEAPGKEGDVYGGGIEALTRSVYDMQRY